MSYFGDNNIDRHKSRESRIQTRIKKKMVMSDSYKDKIYNRAVNRFEVTCCMVPLEEREKSDEEEL